MEKTGRHHRVFLQARVLSAMRDGKVEDWSDDHNYGLRIWFGEFAEACTQMEACMARLELLHDATQGRDVLESTKIRAIVEDVLKNHHDIHEILSLWKRRSEDLEQLPPPPGVKRTLWKYSQEEVNDVAPMRG